MSRFCTNCGSSMQDSAAFCPKCGKASAGAATGAGGGAAVAPAAASTGGLTDNVAGMLAYLFVPAIVFLLVEPYNRNKFVRFHSFQSIFLGVFWIVLNIVFSIVWILWPLWMLVSLGLLVIWVILLIKAYQGQNFKLPVLGDLAEKQV